MSYPRTDGEQQPSRVVPEIFHMILDMNRLFSCFAFCVASDQQ